jgi:hypothetical protein
MSRHRLWRSSPVFIFATVLTAFDQRPMSAAEQLKVTTATLAELMHDWKPYKGKIVVQSDVVELKATYIEGPGFKTGILVYASFGYKNNRFTICADPAILSGLQPYLLEAFRTRVFALTMEGVDRNDPLVYLAVVRRIQKAGFREEHIRAAARSLSFPACLTIKVGLIGELEIIRIDVLLGANDRRLERKLFTDTFRTLSVTAKDYRAAVSKKDQWSQRLGVDGLEVLLRKAWRANLERKAFVEAMLNVQLDALFNDAIFRKNQHDALFWRRVAVAMGGGDPFGVGSP